MKNLFKNISGATLSELSTVFKKLQVLPKSKNQKRAELIERERKFIEEYKRDLPAHSDLRDHGNRTCQKDFYETEFHVKGDKVTALIYKLNATRGRSITKPIHVGRAMCMDIDVRNDILGKSIALRKALGLCIPHDLMYAVQPDEKVAGMIIDVKSSGVRELTDDDDLVVSGIICHINSPLGKMGTIIDDTNAIYRSDEK